MIIQTEEEYNKVMERFNELWQIVHGKDHPLAEEFIELSVAIEQYEKIHFPLSGID